MLTLTSPVETPLHHLPAGVKLAASLVVAVTAFGLDDLFLLSWMLATVTVIYALFGRAFFRAGLSALAFVLPFILVVGIWHLVTEDLAGGAIIVLWLLIAVSVANLMTMTTSLLALVALVERAARPLRVIGLPPRAVGLAVALSVRFVPVFRLRVETLLSAWRARSHRRPRPVIVVPILLCLFDDTERVADALRARGGIPS
jgi:biotin transport system permease protein